MTSISLLVGAALLAAPPPSALVARLKSTLEPGVTSELRVNPGPLETEVLEVFDRTAYPGTGIRSVLLWDGTSWGARGENDIALLVRKRGWLKKPPGAEALTRLWIAAERDTVMAFDAATPAVNIVRGALVLTFVALNPMDPRDRSRVTVTFPPKGAVSVSQAADAAPVVATTLGLEAAAASKDALAIIKALQRLTPAEAATALPTLAGLAASEVETISAEAIARMPDTDDATAALKRVLEGLPAARRAALVELGRAFHGDAFANRLKESR